MSGRRFSRVEEPLLRQTAFSIEQMAPGGIERAEPGLVRRADIQRALGRLGELIGRPGGSNSKKNAIKLVLERTKTLEQMLDVEESEAVVNAFDSPAFCRWS